MRLMALFRFWVFKYTMTGLGLFLLDLQLVDTPCEHTPMPPTHLACDLIIQSEIESDLSAFALCSSI